MSSQTHIVQSFNNELIHLKSVILKMGGFAEEQFSNSLISLKDRNRDLASQIDDHDDRIDNLQYEVDKETVKLLALRQPMGQDLREIISAIKLSSELERIGDYSCNIARRVMTLLNFEPISHTKTVLQMGQIAQEILNDILDAFAHDNIEKSITAWKRDLEVDKIMSVISQDLLEYMAKNPKQVTVGMHLLFIAKNIERISDHATNITEISYFMVKGEPLKKKRPKGDLSSESMLKFD